MSDEIKFLCSECGKEFEPDPDTILETHMGGDCPCCQDLPPEELERQLASGEAFTGEQLAEMNEFQLQEVGLTVEDRDRLLAGEEITTGAVCICKECQDKMAAKPGGAA